MLERLLETTDSGAQKKRMRKFIMGIGSVMTALFVCGLIFSIFSTNLAMGSGSFEISTLLSPTMIPDNAPPPEPEAQPDKPDNASVSKLPQRVVNMLSLDETPVKPPKTVSTVANKYKARPPSKFELRPNGIDKDGIGPAIGKRGPVKTGTTNKTPFGIKGPTVKDKVKPKRTKTPVAPPPRLKKTPDVIRHIGVANGKAIRLVKPVVTSTVRMVGAKGSVKVNVLISKHGKVVSANAVSGHPLLRPLSVKAALRSTFTPTLLNRVPVKVRGVIIYNFK